MRTPELAFQSGVLNYYSNWLHERSAIDSFAPLPKTSPLPEQPTPPSLPPSKPSYLLRLFARRRVATHASKRLCAVYNLLACAALCSKVAHAHCEYLENLGDLAKKFLQRAVLGLIFPLRTLDDGSYYCSSIAHIRMGRVSICYLSDSKIWACGKCGTHVTRHDDIVSKQFQGIVQVIHLDDLC